METVRGCRNENIKENRRKPQLDGNGNEQIRRFYQVISEWIRKQIELNGITTLSIELQDPE